MRATVQNRSRTLALLAAMATVAVALTAQHGSPAGAVPVSCGSGPDTFDASTTAEIAGIDANHDMRLYNRNGVVSGGSLMWPAGGLWAGFKAIAAGDFNGDGLADIAGIDANNDMRLYAGDGQGHLTGGSLMWPAGGLWRGFKAIAAADFNGDGHTDVAGIDANNDMRLYAGDGQGHLTGGSLMWPAGGLWKGFKAIVAADFGGDGHADVAGIDANNDMRLYRGDGHGGLSGGYLMWPGTGRWAGFSHLAAGDFTGDGYVDIAGTDANNDLRVYPGDGTGHLATSGGQLIWPSGGLWRDFTAIVSLPPPPCVPTRTAILPLGDSITYGIGSTTGDGYRGSLATRLDTTSTMGSGWLYEGGVQSGALFWSNEGHSGYTIRQISGFVPAGLAAAPNGGSDVNLVLLDAGTNDALHYAGTADQLTADTIALLRTLLGFSPTIRVVVAQITITTAASATEQQAEQDFDAGLPAKIKDLGLDGRVAVADMRDVHLSSDGVHPDDSGYQEMADRWYAALSTAGWLPSPKLGHGEQHSNGDFERSASRSSQSVPPGATPRGHATPGWPSLTHSYSPDSGLSHDRRTGRAGWGAWRAAFPARPVTSSALSHKPSTPRSAATTSRPTSGRSLS